MFSLDIDELLLDQYAAQCEAANDLLDAYDQVSEPGVYCTPDGAIFQVRWNMQRCWLHARRFDSSRRSFHFEYGAIKRLRASWRLSLEALIELSIRLNMCAFCGRTLTAEQSAARGIGPRCYKNYASKQTTNNGKS